MEFSDDIGKLQRLMAASSAGIARRQAIMDNLVIKADDKIIDIGCGGGYLLELLAKSIGTKGRIYGLDPSEEQISQARLRCEKIENISLLKSSEILKLLFVCSDIKSLLFNVFLCSSPSFSPSIKTFKYVFSDR